MFLRDESGKEREFDHETIIREVAQQELLSLFQHWINNYDKDTLRHMMAAVMRDRVTFPNSRIGFCIENTTLAIDLIDAELDALTTQRIKNHKKYPTLDYSDYLLLKPSQEETKAMQIFGHHEASKTATEKIKEVNDLSYEL